MKSTEFQTIILFPIYRVLIRDNFLQPNIIMVLAVILLTKLISKSKFWQIMDHKCLAINNCIFLMSILKVWLQKKLYMH